MAQQQQSSGKPWSGTNPIPNIQKFVDSLDKDKRERDRQIDEQNKSHEQQHKSGVKPHENAPQRSGGKTVTDPTTGNQVVIEDVGKDFMKTVRDPQVPGFPAPCSSSNLLTPSQLSVPNANLGKETVCILTGIKARK
jgi:hypothetical protein